MLEKLHLYGMKEVEPAIMAALLTKKPVLLIGETGTAKTEATKRIAEALGLRFHRYDASKAVFEDVIGFPNPKSLSNGVLSYVQTPLTLWDKQFVLIDEINRAALSMQNKWFEVVNEATLMGKETDLIYRWSAMNPSSAEYLGTSELDLALRDRFALFIRVPSPQDMNDGALADILRNGNTTTDFDLKAELAKVNGADTGDGDKTKFVLELSKVLRWEHKKPVSGRRLVLMHQVLTQCIRLEELYEHSIRSIMKYTMYDVLPDVMESVLDLVLSKSPIARKTVTLLASTPVQKLKTVLNEAEETRTRAAALGRLLTALKDFCPEKAYVYSRLLTTVKDPAIRDIVWSKFKLPNSMNRKLVKKQAEQLVEELKLKN